LRLMPGNAEWSCFKASLHDHLIFEILLISIIPLRASYTSILFYFCKKCYRGLPPSCVFARPANRGRHSNRRGFVFGNRPCGIRSFVATTYAAHPCQIPHLPIRRGERTSGHERSVAPPPSALTSLNISALLPDFTAYRTPTALVAPHFPYWHKVGNILL
jgi:hypothetical protein